MLRNLRAQVVDACRQVDRGGRDVAVPHHFGQTVDVASAFEHQRGEGVPELVYAEAFAQGGADLID